MKPVLSRGLHISAGHKACGDPARWVEVQLLAAPYNVPESICPRGGEFETPQERRESLIEYYKDVDRDVILPQPLAEDADVRWEKPVEVVKAGAGGWTFGKLIGPAAQAAAMCFGLMRQLAIDNMHGITDRLQTKIDALDDTESTLRTAMEAVMADFTILEEAVMVGEHDEHLLPVFAPFPLAGNKLSADKLFKDWPNKVVKNTHTVDRTTKTHSQKSP